MSIATTTNHNLILDGKYTHYYLHQRPGGTKVYRATPGSPTVEVPLPAFRYSLTSESPRCGHGVSEFERDFRQVMTQQSGEFDR